MQQIKREAAQFNPSYQTRAMISVFAHGCMNTAKVGVIIFIIISSVSFYLPFFLHLGSYIGSTFFISAFPLNVLCIFAEYFLNYMQQSIKKRSSKNAKSDLRLGGNFGKLSSLISETF